MRRALTGLASCALGALLVTGAAHARPQGAAAVCLNDTGALSAAEARLLPIGNYRGPPASNNERAQRLFEQGLVFGWGFNFAEAVRSFRAAVLADLDCSLCRWGIAWAVGPSINHDMTPADVPVAIDAIAQARAYAPPAGSQERALIDALAARYSEDRNADQDRLAIAYADAMRKLAARQTNDADIAVLAAEAIMNAHPYDYWRDDGRPRPWTSEIITLLDRANRIAPEHPGAHHYRIHLYEGSRTPEKALASAERIGSLAPGVGHLVHMPSHIFLRVGRYHDAVLANRAAVEADRQYLAAVKANDTYAADYVPHNVHFLWASALWSGEEAIARLAADELAQAAERLPNEPARRGTRQHFQATPWITLTRNQQWDEVLARAVPASTDAPYLDGLIRYARGMAHMAKGDLTAARHEADLVASRALAADEQKLAVKNINPASSLLGIAHSLLAAEIALARRDAAAAIRHGRAAVAAEDRLEVDEPPAWQIPTRHVLARALLVGGRPAEARKVYLDDLHRHPENAVALAGLAAAERRLGRQAVATGLEQRARAAWKASELELPSPAQPAAQRMR